jgi:hypothetical protein
MSAKLGFSLPVSLSLSVSVREEHRIRVFEYKFLERIFGPAKQNGEENFIMGI